jgi:hypothetical protein
VPNLSLVDIDAIRHDNERGVERRGIQCRVRHTKCRIRNIDRGTHVNAYCNPDQIVIEKAVPWETASQSKGDAPILEFRNAEPMFLSCTLAFGDCSSQANVYEAHVEALTALTLIATAASFEKKRPPLCLFTWGTAFPPFKGVIESLTTTYTDFLDDGTPIRAVCELRMRQASKLRVKARKRKRATSGG